MNRMEKSGEGRQGELFERSRDELMNDVRKVYLGLPKGDEFTNDNGHTFTLGHGQIIERCHVQSPAETIRHYGYDINGD